MSAPGICPPLCDGVISAPGPRPTRIRLDMTLREVMGADQSWHEGGWTTLLYAAQDFAGDACEIGDGRTSDDMRSDTELGARDLILAVIALAQKSLAMFDAQEAEQAESKGTVTP